jgi:Ca2+-binding EF-hand superfamily protein
LAATLATQSPIQEAQIAEAFDQIDKDDRGYITRGNLLRIIGQGGDEAYVDTLMSECHVKHYGRISYDEFLQSFQSTSCDEAT